MARQNNLILEANNLLSQRVSKNNEKFKVGDYKDLYLKAFLKVSQFYFEGTLDFLKGHYPKIFQEMMNFWHTLDALWVQGMAGKNTLERFKRILAQWHQLNLLANKLLSKHQNKNVTGPQVVDAIAYYQSKRNRLFGPKKKVNTQWPREEKKSIETLPVVQLSLFEEIK